MQMLLQGADAALFLCNDLLKFRFHPLIFLLLPNNGCISVCLLPLQLVDFIHELRYLAMQLFLLLLVRHNLTVQPDDLCRVPLLALRSYR